MSRVLTLDTFDTDDELSSEKIENTRLESCDEYRHLVGIAELTTEKYIANEATWIDVQAADAAVDNFIKTWEKNKVLGDDVECMCEMCNCHKW